MPFADARAHDVAGIDVAVDVGLDHAVHRQAAEPAYHLGMVADLLRAQDDLVAVGRDVRVQLGDALFAQRESRRRGHRHGARAQQLQHPVLDYFGVGGQRPERPAVQPGERGVGDVPHAGLKRQQRGGQPPASGFVGQEVQEMTGDKLRIAIGRPQWGGVIRVVRQDDRADLLERTAQVRHADPVGGPEDLQRPAVRRQHGAVVNVVHAFQFGWLPGVHLEDDPVSQVDPGIAVTHRGGRDQCTVCGDARHLDERDIKVPEESSRGHLRHV